MRYIDRRLADIAAEQGVEPSPQGAGRIFQATEPKTPGADHGHGLPRLSRRGLGGFTSIEERRKYYREYNRLRRQTIIGRRQMVASNLRATHKMTLERYQLLYRYQGGRCAICGDGIVMAYDPTSERRKRGSAPHGAHVDHDHGCCPSQKSCGLCVRGLLCSRCNVGLACFRDNPALMRSAADYVEKGTFLDRC
jgi:hypothetical protein